MLPIAFAFMLLLITEAYLRRSVCNYQRYRQKMSLFQKVIKVSEWDDRPHRHLVLPNGINVVLVSDKRSEKSSCALGIKIGAAADSLPGLAHLTEHAVFLGSAKYPAENAYKAFLNRHGGGSNGGTGMEQTVYKFYVNADAFREALDIFSGFFTCPTLARDAIAREVLAVDAEDSKNRILEGRRQLQAIKHFLSLDTSFRKFSTGNLLTLAYGDIDRYSEQLADAVQTFHRTYYQPSNMAVVLVGPQSIDELEELVAVFSSISSSNGSAEVKVGNGPSPLLMEASPSDNTKKQPLDSENPHEFSLDRVFRKGGGRLIALQAMSPHVRELSLYFPLPFNRSKDSNEWYTAFPTTLLGYILSHKGSGGLFASLQDRGWLTALSGTPRYTFPPFTLFEVSLSLTASGLEHYQEVVEEVHSYFQLIRDASPAELTRIWSEMAALHRLEFSFRAPFSAYEYAPHLAHNLLAYPVEDIACAGSFLAAQPDLSTFHSYLNMLTWDRMVAVLRVDRATSWPLLKGESLLPDRVLPNDNVHYLNESMKRFESHLLAEGNDIEKLRSNPDLYCRGLHEFILSQQEEDQKELYYGLHLFDSPFPRNENLQDERIKANYNLPEVNRFICYNLLSNLSSSEHLEEISAWKNSRPPLRSPGLVRFPASDIQQEEEERDIVRWMTRDAMFGFPKASVFWHLPISAIERVHTLFLSMIASVFSQISARKYYSAGAAGIRYELTLSRRGISLTGLGYSEQLPRLLQEISDQLRSPAFWKEEMLGDKLLFENCRDRLVRSLQSWTRDRPDSQADSILGYILSFDNHLAPDLLQYAEKNISFESFHACVEDIFLASIDNSIVPVEDEKVVSAEGDNNFYTDIRQRKPILYAHFGAKDNAEEQMKLYSSFLDNLWRSWKNSPTGHNSVQEEINISLKTTLTRQLPTDRHTVIALPSFHDEEANSALLLYFQVDRITARIAALALIVNRLFSEPAFSILRTQKQLGYIVSFSISSSGSGRNTVRGFKLRILSKQYSALTLHKEAVAFFDVAQSSVLEGLGQDAFEKLVSNIITSLQDPVRSAHEEAELFWQEILLDLSYYDFIMDNVIAELRSIRREDVVAFAQQYLYGEGEGLGQRKSVALMVFGNNHSKDLDLLRSTDNVRSLIVSENSTFLKKVDIDLVSKWEQLQPLRERLPFFPHYREN